MRVRPMTLDDVATCEQISDRTFQAVDLRARRMGDAEVTGRSPAGSQTWCARTRHLVSGDPGGCWVAESDAGILGFATSLRRGSVWALATFTVVPEAQGRGIGRELIDRALAYGAECPRGMLSSSVDPGAVRRYHHAGFALHPQLYFEGEVRALAPVDGVREGLGSDRALLDRIDQRARGATRATDHDVLAGEGRLVVFESDAGAGYAYASPTKLVLLSATDPASAEALLRQVLSGTSGRYLVPHVTGANQWAIATCLDAGLEPRFSGYLALRGMNPPMSYVHHGGLL